MYTDRCLLAVFFFLFGYLMGYVVSTFVTWTYMKEGYSSSSGLRQLDREPVSAGKCLE